ncbi:hypothetical protein OG455_27865 [Kitasatospora sp. NBC_01287]|uniref:hypothetical protein n=1 Tax=Kitasatospora sp. NBC_01287 TaxID=2903573 RepID=UPI00225A4EE2|nr:hypothetical protein [Kitasatospora sp. NBC_01287]MCX4749279.1 hypothetical protein [Kitasatospora sp. NBC_01287]
MGGYPGEYPRGRSLFHDGPGLADAMPGLQTQVTAAAQYLNSHDHDQATKTTLALTSRLAAGGECTKGFAKRIARHLVETQAQRLAGAN